MLVLSEHKNVTSILCAGDVFDRIILDSYARAMLERWEMELKERIIPENRASIRNIVKKHSDDSSYDELLWNEIVSLKNYIAKTSSESDSLFDRIKKAIDEKDLKKVSVLQIEMNQKMTELRDRYKEYCNNQI